MKLKSYAYRCVAVVCAIVAVACVDENFSIDKVSKEVSVLDGKTVLPVGTFEKMCLGDLLKDVDTSELQKNEDGSYTFVIDIAEEKISASDFELPTTFEIEEMGSTFAVDNMPSLDFDSYTAGVNETFGLQLTGGLSSLLGSNAQFELTEGYLTYMQMMGQETSLVAEISETATVKAVEFTLPKQIKNVSTVYFKDIEEGHPGAPLRVGLNLNGLAEVNGGGKFIFSLKPMATDLLICDVDGNEVLRNDDGVYYVENDIPEGAQYINFALYIAALENPNEPVDGEIAINPSMSFDISFELAARAGMMYAGVPEVTVFSEFALKDAEVIFDSSVNLVDIEFGGEGSEGFGFKIDSLPEQVKSINSINLDDNSVLTLYADGLDWLNKNSDSVSIDMTLPECLVLRPIGDSYQYDEASHMLTMTIGAISEGLSIGVEAIDFSNIDQSGEVSIDFNPAVRVHFTNENPISIKGFIPEEDVVVSVGLRQSTLSLESVSAEIDFSESIEESLPVGESLGEVNLDVNGLGISPVLEIMITNPLTLEASIAASLTPVVDGVAQEQNTLPINAVIKQAAYDEVTGEVIPTATRLVLAKKEYEEQYPAAEGYTFIECNLDTLLGSSIPDSIELSAAVALPEGVITLHLTDALEFSYAGKLTLPVAFDDGLSISYEDAIDITNENDGSIISRVIRNDAVKVGDIALIAEIETTLPLELAVTTTLYGKDGEVLPTKVGFVEGSNTISGPADGATPTKCPVRLVFDLADESGSLNELADIASIGLKVAANGVSEVAASLKDDQYISAELKLEVAGGITLDLGKLLDKAEEEYNERK